MRKSVCNIIGCCIGGRSRRCWRRRCWRYIYRRWRWVMWRWNYRMRKWRFWREFFCWFYRLIKIFLEMVREILMRINRLSGVSWIWSCFSFMRFYIVEWFFWIWWGWYIFWYVVVKFFWVVRRCFVSFFVWSFIVILWWFVCLLYYFNFLRCLFDIIFLFFKRGGKKIL